MKTKSMLCVLLLGAAASLAAQGKLGIQATAPVADGIIGASEYGYSEAIAGGKAYLAVKGEVLYLAFEAPTSGWIALGLGTGRMNGSRLYMAYVKDGKAFYSEELGKGWSHSKAPDVLALGGFAAEKDGKTIYEFSVPLKAGLVGTEIPLIAAVGSTDGFVTKHVNRGSIRVAFSR